MRDRTDDFAALVHNSVDALHLIIEAVKLTMADRIAYQSIPDPPLAGLLSKAYAAAQRARIDPRRAAISGGERYMAVVPPGAVSPGGPYGYQREHATHFSVVDGEGKPALRERQPPFGVLVTVRREGHTHCDDGPAPGRVGAGRTRRSPAGRRQHRAYWAPRPGG